MCHLNTQSIKARERKGGNEGHHWVFLLDVLLPCLVPLPKSSLGYLLLPGPAEQPGFEAEWADLSHEISTAPCKQLWRLSWGGSKGAKAAFW